MKSQMLDRENFVMSILDTKRTRTLTESDLSQLSRHHVPYHDEKEPVRVSAASGLWANKSAREPKPHSLQTQANDAKGRQNLSRNLLDSEHKPLSSASQAQPPLYAHGRSRTKSGRGRSFSEDSSLDFCRGEKETGRKLDMLDLGRDVSPSRRLNANDAWKTSAPGLAKDSWLDSYEHLCLAYSSANRELLRRLADDRRAADNVQGYWSKVAKEGLTSAQSSGGDFLGERYLEMDLEIERSLKHGSDAKLNSHSLPLTSPTSASFGDFHLKCRSLLDDIPLEDSQPVSSPISVVRKGREPPVSRSLSPSRTEFKHSKSPTHCFKEANMEHHCSEQKSGHLGTESLLGTEKASPVVVVLLQLLELVDHHWSGPGSLLLKKDFLAPAHDLLVYLMTATSSLQTASSAAVATPSSNCTGITYGIHKDRSKYPQHFLGIDEPLEKPAPSPVLSFKEQDSEATAALSYEPLKTHSFSYGELLSRNKQLSAQLDALTSELKQFKKQQDTISLLRESQKSLISTNNFLLQQLKREQEGPSSARETILLEKVPASAKGPFFARTSFHAPSSSAVGSGRLCRSPQLSHCPL